MTKLLLIGFVLHFIADFLLQSRAMGKNKSTQPLVLAKHIGIQISVVFLGLIPFVGFEKAAIISLLNGLVHGLIDWNIWKLYKISIQIWMKNNPNHAATLKYKETGIFEYWNDKVFYDTIGLDQLLHISTLTLLIGIIR